MRGRGARARGANSKRGGSSSQQSSTNSQGLSLTDSPNLPVGFSVPSSEPLAISNASGQTSEREEDLMAKSYERIEAESELIYQKAVNSSEFKNLVKKDEKKFRSGKREREHATPKEIMAFWLYFIRVREDENLDRDEMKAFVTTVVDPEVLEKVQFPLVLKELNCAYRFLLDFYSHITPVDYSGVSHPKKYKHIYFRSPPYEEKEHPLYSMVLDVMKFTTIIEGIDYYSLSQDACFSPAMSSISKVLVSPPNYELYWRDGGENSDFEESEKPFRREERLEFNGEEEEEEEYEEEEEEKEKEEEEKEEEEEKDEEEETSSQGLEKMKKKSAYLKKFLTTIIKKREQKAEAKANSTPSKRHLVIILYGHLDITEVTRKSGAIVIAEDSISDEGFNSLGEGPFTLTIKDKLVSGRKVDVEKLEINQVKVGTGLRHQRICLEIQEESARRNLVKTKIK